MGDKHNNIDVEKKQALDLQHQLYYICRVNAINFELSNL